MCRRMRGKNIGKTSYITDKCMSFRGDGLRLELTSSRISLINCLMIMFNFTEAFYKVTMFKDKILHGCSFQNTSETTIGNCLAKCLENCSCRAFRMCDGDKTCSLCLSSNITLKTEDKLEKCGYFTFERNQQHGCKNGVMKGCIQDTNCCLTSQPCLNTEVCKPSYHNDILHSPRFTCDMCPPGYRGNRCEQPIKSCRGYVNGSDHDPPASGKYTIIDEKNQPFRVFCNFVKSTDDVTVSWTLIQSYQFEKKNDKQFQKAFFQDHPKNAEAPNWKAYRLPLSRMKSIQNDSSKWRMTCRYDTDSLNKTDYMEGLKSEVDILRYKNFKKKKVGYINVRGYECMTNCLAVLVQKFGIPFHHRCPLNPPSKVFNPNSRKTCPKGRNGTKGENNFGQYYCVNPAHRCSMDNSSTTQTWLGA